MYPDLQDKTALITGAAGILGITFCEAMLKQGVRVVMVDHNEESLLEKAALLQNQFGVDSILPIVTDIAQYDCVKQMVNQAVNTFGSIDILHNNAATKGGSIPDFFASYEDYELSTWRDIMSVNLDAAFLVSQAVGKQMIVQGSGGSIIQTASIYGVIAPDQSIYEGSSYLGMEINTPAVYSASKAGLLGLTRYLAAYWAKYNIRVNALTPGGIESGQNETFKKNYSGKVPLGRMGKAEELCGALLLLASEQSSYITGQNIVVDGGYCCW